MSLIQTLINKGYHAYQQLKETQSPVAQAERTPAGGPVVQDDADTPVRLSQLEGLMPRPKPEQTVKAWQHEIGQAIASLQRVLRQKVAEYRLPEGTDLNVRPVDDRVQLDAAIDPSIRAAIESDLNRDPAFVSTLNTVWKGKPALDTLQNVVRLQSAYGTTNQVFGKVLEQPEGPVGLSELARRFEQLRSPVQANTETAA
ncbi:MAG: hypothetical protein D6758_02590 [Gammaproteobacteria bacterium]|nr:MAG: hypothetical protein D6758_02590 [Gammaproteobacteria bacterium]